MKAKTLILLVCLLGCKPAPEPPPVDPDDPPVVDDTTTQEELDLIDYHNQFRKESNVTTSLFIDEKLMAVAQGHADWMAANSRMSHTGAGNSSVGRRITDGGYRFASAGENIAAGYRTVEEVMRGWKGSSGHRANMLRNYQHIGVAVADSKGGTRYWCTVFASPLTVVRGYEIDIPAENIPDGIAPGSD